MRVKELKPIMDELLLYGTALIETHEPKKVKEDLSRYKHNCRIPGLLGFQNSAADKETPKGEIIYHLTITYDREEAI